MTPEPGVSGRDWPAGPLGQVADFINGRAFKPSDWSKAGTPIIRIQNLNGGAEYNYFEGGIEARFAVQAGDLLFSWSGTRGTSFGPHFWRGPDGVLNQHIFNVRNLRGVDQSFLFHALKHITRAIERRAHGGTGIVHITKGQLEAFEVPLPPLPEQRKIAGILSSVDEVIEKTEAVIEQLRAVKKAMMQELLTRGLPGRHTRFKRTEIGEVPEEWDAVRLRDVTNFQPGYAFKSADFVEAGDRLLRGSNVAPGAIDWSPDRTKHFPVGRRDEFAGYILNTGDIVIGMDRPFVEAGFKIARLKEADVPALLLQRVGRFAELRGIQADYLWFLAQSSFVEGHLRVQQKGTDLPHISRDEILDSQVPVPKVEEQLRISRVLSAVEGRQSTERAAAAWLRSAKSGLMDALLSGTKRVQVGE
jgi:type I restriction enzyme S subunit